MTGGEAALAALEERMKNFEAQVNSLQPLSKEVAVFGERLSALVREQQEIRRVQQQQTTEAAAREDRAEADRISARRQLWTHTVAIVSALIGAAAVIISSLPH